MAHFHVKTKKGRPYLYVREIARVAGKPKVISQIYIGSPERTTQLVQSPKKESLDLKVEELGALWIAHQMDKDFDLVRIVNDIVPRDAKEVGPSIGEYFLYAVLNRMIEAKSKHKLARWYHTTAIQQIRPVEIDELNSQRYWEKWDRVSEEQLKQISHAFFSKVWASVSTKADCLLFDTTNYYTFMSSHTKSELSKRGHNKASRHHLRQIGLGLLVDRHTRLPLHYHVYPGNIHDSRVFESIMNDMFRVVCQLNPDHGEFTAIIDKGMNADGNFSWIDRQEKIHFITTYSPYFAESLSKVPLDNFTPVDTHKNRRLIAEEKKNDCLRAYRTKGDCWGKERTVVVTFNPITSRKKNYTLTALLGRLRQELLVMRTKVRNGEPQWRDPEVINARYIRLCHRLHISSNLYVLHFNRINNKLIMTFNKDNYRIHQKRISLGRNIIVTDQHEWTTDELVQANIDRWQIEERFKLSKDEDLVGTRPVRHWTDSKIRCHFFTCVVAITYMRLLELKLQKAGIQRTVTDVMDEMKHFHSVLSVPHDLKKPFRRLETPTEGQTEIFKVLGFQVDAKGVLQPISA